MWWYKGISSVGADLVEWSHLCGGEAWWCQFQQRGSRECIAKRIFEVSHWCQYSVQSNVLDCAGKAD